MKRRNLMLSVTMLAALAAHMTAQAETKLSALFMSQAAYSEDDVTAMTKAFEQANPGVKVNLEFVPYDALHDKIVVAKGAGASGYDVVLFDVVWPAEFAERGFLKDVTSRINPADMKNVFSGAWTTVEYKGKYYGMPWILDTKFLFYNTEMLKKAGISTPPKTWAEVAAQAKIIKDKGIVKYPLVWSWAQKEAIVCDYATLTAAYGGQFFDNGKPQFENGGSLEAVKYMKSTIDAGLTNPNSLEYEEEDVRKVFSNGEAAFALNWGYMYNMAKDPKESKVVGKVAMAPAPGVNGKAAFSSTNGSMGLGVTANSAHTEEAWKYIQYMTSQPVQTQYAKLSLPIWKTAYTPAKGGIYTDQQEYVEAALKAWPLMTARPAHVSYQGISSTLQKNLHSVLLGKANAPEAMKQVSDAAAKAK